MIEIVGYCYEKHRYSKIKGLRNKLELTQEQLAQKVGVTFSSIHNWEKGTRKPYPFLLRSLLKMAEETGLKNIEKGKIRR